MVDCKHLFQEFHPGRFLVFAALLLFGILLSFKLDEVLNCSFWTVFIPLWIWKMVTVVGCAVGIHSYIIQQDRVHEMGTIADFQSMLLSTSMQMLLLSFEVCLCYKLTFSTEIMKWYLVFMPLFLLSILSVVICGWAWKKDRSLDLELLFSVNMLQFVLLVLRLESLVMWTWKIIMIPLWILLGVVSIAVIYYIALTAVLLCTNDILPSLRTPRTAASCLYSLANFSLILFLGLLATKLDSPVAETHSFIAIFLPYHLGMGSLVLSAFYNKGGNPWWFGIREEFCMFLLKKFPAIRVYGNISYIYATRDSAIPIDTPVAGLNQSDSKNSLPKVTFSNVELPD